MAPLLRQRQRQRQLRVAPQHRRPSPSQKVQKVSFLSEEKENVNLRAGIQVKTSNNGNIPQEKHKRSLPMPLSCDIVDQIDVVGP